MDVAAYNRDKWDAQVRRGNKWTVPVTPEAIAAARRGEWSIVLTPVKPVPRAWFPPLDGCRVLGLASGGGQQGPILAAAGADVTVFDNSPAQLAQDELVARREGLALRTVRGDMRDLGAFADASFDLVVHPCANAFVRDVRPVWREAFRVLKPGGALLAGFWNPAAFVFDEALALQGTLAVRHALPYSDLESLTEAERAKLAADDEPLVFGHMLEAQLGGQMEAGFAIVGLYEDESPGHALAAHMPMFIATRARKPAAS